ncbi:hypothetical protein CPAV1605_639 [seawater metagenome]|uniref:Uncharacterized protein n=1 Tax=seawater metagenome TaxID=1561972 RepID=A0A5E8CJU3_9ZZZZ
MDSDTSDDFNYLNSNNPNINISNKMEDNQQQSTQKKNLTTDTDFHLNFLANPAKVKIDLSNNEDESGDQENDSESNVSKFLDNINDGSSDTSIVIDEEVSDSSDHKSTNTPPSQKQSVLINNNKKNHTSSSEKRHIPQAAPPQNKELSEKELRFKKIELLRKLSEIKAAGYELSKDYDFNSDIEEMEYEFDLLKSMKDKQNGVGLYKSFMLNAITAIEFLNERYDPFDFKLSGWSEHMNVGIDDYGDVFGEIYEKYRGTGKKMEPEIKLLLMIVASGASFHASNTMFKKLPGLEKLIKENPALLSKLTTQVFNDKDTQNSQFMTRQEINAQEQIKHNQLKQQQIRQEQLKKQEELRKEQAIRNHLVAQQQQQLMMQKQQEQQMQQMQQQQLMQQQQQQQLQQQRTMQMPVPAYKVNNPTANQRNSLNNNQVPSVQFQRQQEINNMAINGEITGPSNIENIINKVKKDKLSDSNNGITISEESSSNDRLLSSSTFQNDGSATNKRGRKKKKNTISIVT